MRRQQGVHWSSGDEWLTPPELIKALGSFTTDPCCADNMPWKTAKYMYTKKEDGLAQKWKGRVWLNPPYSNARPWIEKFVEHRNGIALVSAKSTDAKWCQLLLKNCDTALWLSSPRIHFYHTTGIESDGVFLSSLLVSMTSNDSIKLTKITTKYPGVRFKRIINA